MAYFWTCPTCSRVQTFADDEDPQCSTCTASLDVISELYDEQMREYNAYVSIARGDDRESWQAVSPKRVEAARNDWHAALQRLRDAGGTPDVVRAMLQERVGKSTTRRKAVA